ncbi:Gfo/Idh/MocA family oxidoreductase [Streptomyces sp. NPDC002922]|uniref:Gfo/Idh/MocA family protein n=1 Tax=Streptomyces sp. NPDC002922 TaxID=3154439 RepID=UPI0033BABE40
MPSVVTIAVVGAGDRGTGHAGWALAYPERAKVVAVAEPRRARRDRLVADHGLEAASAMDDWRVLAARGRIADAVLICTLDREHLEPVGRVAQDVADRENHSGLLHRCHDQPALVLRHTQALKRIVDSGRLGEIVSVQHLEPVGFWHQAHSFVRGNWRREDEATSMLMAKSCHDLDWLQYVLGRPPVRVSSFGRLSHFRPENKPGGAADRCLDCAVETSCPYSAKRDCGDQLARGEHIWPLSVVIDEFTPQALDTALREGPYGRCVYACDNDVVDHQVVAMEFASGATGTFTMTAFTEQADRQTRIFGTRAELRGDGEHLRVYDFLTRSEELIDLGTEGTMDAAGGHGGGDSGLMDAFVAAIATGDPGLVKSGPQESLTSHLTVLAAERARHNNTVESIPLSDVDTVRAASVADNGPETAQES